MCAGVIRIEQCDRMGLKISFGKTLWRTRTDAFIKINRVGEFPI